MPSDPVSSDVEETVERAIADNDVVVFIKGTPARPRCGFSQRAVGLLSRHRDDFATVNVLESLGEYRAALEARSGWETIPQTYVEGEFVGGSDILQELDERGELAATLNGETTASMESG